MRYITEINATIRNTNINMNIVRQGDITGFDDAEVIDFETEDEEKENDQE